MKGKRKVVGFRRRKGSKKSYPITKSEKELAQKKMVRNASKFKGVGPRESDFSAMHRLLDTGEGEPAFTAREFTDVFEDYFRLLGRGPRRTISVKRAKSFLDKYIGKNFGTHTLTVKNEKYTWVKHQKTPKWLTLWVKGHWDPKWSVKDNIDQLGQDYGIGASGGPNQEREDWYEQRTIEELQPMQTNERDKKVKAFLTEMLRWKENEKKYHPTKGTRT